MKGFFQRLEFKYIHTGFVVPNRLRFMTGIQRLRAGSWALFSMAISLLRYQVVTWHANMVPSGFWVLAFFALWYSLFWLHWLLILELGTWLPSGCWRVLGRWDKKILNLWFTCFSVHCNQSVLSLCIKLLDKMPKCDVLWSQGRCCCCINSWFWNMEESL